MSEAGSLKLLIAEDQAALRRVIGVVVAKVAGEVRDCVQAQELEQVYMAWAPDFVLIDGGTRVREIIDGMIERGVFVRDRTKDPSTPTCFRLTTGVVEHTRKAVETLEALCGAR